MNTRSMVLSVVALTALAGCSGATVKPFDIGGSKADGTVIMGANLGEFEEMDWSSADEVALKRCVAWGYTKVEGFTGIRSTCTNPYGFWDCAEREVTRTYQCID